MADAPRRIIVDGVSGSGKTLLAAHLARRLDRLRSRREVRDWLRSVGTPARPR